jgi:MFS transporter, NNP family, nitrate/nitrite transporter
MVDLLAGTFGLMNIFARAVGGIMADKVGKRSGLLAKGRFLALLIAI